MTDPTRLTGELTTIMDALEAARLYVLRYPHGSVAGSIISRIDDARVATIKLQGNHKIKPLFVESLHESHSKYTGGTK